MLDPSIAPEKDVLALVFLLTCSVVVLPVGVVGASGSAWVVVVVFCLVVRLHAPHVVK